MTYENSMLLAIEQARQEIPLTDWYTATEAAAIEHCVSLPELQRALEQSSC